MEMWSVFDKTLLVLYIIEKVLFHRTFKVEFSDIDTFKFENK